MSETKFTKGEWGLGAIATGAVWCSPAQTGIVKPREILIASVYPHDAVLVDERLANMKLIAAAPEMFEALRLIATHAPEMGGDWALMKAQSAIKKATE